MCITNTEKDVAVNAQSTPIKAAAHAALVTTLLAAAQTSASPSTSAASSGYVDDGKTNCPECIKDDAQKRAQGSKVGGVITKDFNKNVSYVLPPIVLGDGHALKIDLTAPGNIVQVTRSCMGPACGWTHDVTYQNVGTPKVTWIGWSNSGDNCLLTFTITYR